MNHPAGVSMDGLWFGPEVEGSQWRGVHTAFISRKLTDEELDRLYSSTAVFVFLTEAFEDWEWFRVHVLPKYGDAATVAREVWQVDAFLALPFASRLRMFVHVFGTPWVHKLRPQDEVQLGEPFDLVSFQRARGAVTKPKDYEEDAG